MGTLILAGLGSCLLGLLMHWWPQSSARARRRMSFGASVAGLGFLVAALRSEGLRETAVRRAVILGEAVQTGTTLASASFAYYVLTAVCLLLGFAGLVAGDRLARWLAPRFVLSATAVAWFLTVVRFLLEKGAAPPHLAQAVGITWMAPIAGAYFATCLRDEPLPWRRIVRALILYAFAARSLVALLGIVATRRQLGSHYDVSSLTELRLAFADGPLHWEPASWPQIFWLVVVPQVLVWPLLTVAAGVLGALVARRVLRLGSRQPPRRGLSVPRTSAGAPDESRSAMAAPPAPRHGTG